MRSALITSTTTTVALVLGLLAGGCDAPNDTVVYAAEFATDKNGLPVDGEPRYELTVVLKPTPTESGTVQKAYAPPPVDQQGQYNPTEANAVSLTDVKKDGKYYMVDLKEHNLAHLNPFRAYSPYRATGEAYREVKLGTNNFDTKAEKHYRVIAKDAPCWRCGGTNELWYYNAARDVQTFEDCDECDDFGFTEYYGIRRLEDGDATKRTTYRKPERVNTGG